MKIDAMHDWTPEERTNKEREWTQALFTLRLQKATGQLENPMRIREMKKDLARLKTLVHRPAAGAVPVKRAPTKRAPAKRVPAKAEAAPSAAQPKTKKAKSPKAAPKSAAPKKAAKAATPPKARTAAASKGKKSK